MNHKKEKSKIWLVLFYLCFAVVVIAAGILFKNYIDSQAADSQFDSMQASVNYKTDGNDIDMDTVYINSGVAETAERIWLYYDCKGVAFDNGLQQFLHDCRKQDGVIRYYVVSDKRQEGYIPKTGKKLNSGVLNIND